MFKGSCFIIFKDAETCKKFVEAESIKYKDTELLRKFKNDYFEDKKKEIQEKRKKDKKKNNEAPAANKVEESSFPKGAVLHFTGLSDDKTISREEIKEQLKKVDDAEIAYIDYNKGDSEGYIRFVAENAATEVFKKLKDGELEIGETKLKFKILEGEEEDKFLKKTADALNKRREVSRKGKKRKGNFSSSGPRNKAKKAKE